MGDPDPPGPSPGGLCGEIVTTLHSLQTDFCSSKQRIVLQCLPSRVKSLGVIPQAVHLCLIWYAVTQNHPPASTPLPYMVCGDVMFKIGGKLNTVKSHLSDSGCCKEKCQTHEYAGRKDNRI